MKKEKLVSSFSDENLNNRLCISECKELTAKNNLFLIILVFILLININFISAQKYSVNVTPEHPFLLANGNYVAVKDLKVGMQLMTDNGKKIKITSVKEVIPDKPVLVYNLEAGQYSNFILPGGVVVHNSGSRETFSQIVQRLQKGLEFWNSDEVPRIEKTRKLLKDNNLPSLTPSQEIELLIAHYDPATLSKVWRLRQTGFSNEQIKLLGNNYIFGDENFVTVYHGASDINCAHNIQMYGPIPTKKFYVSKDYSVAQEFAGPKGKILTYRIPKEFADSILGLEHPYISSGTPCATTEYIIEGIRAKQLHKYLDPKDKLNIY